MKKREFLLQTIKEFIHNQIEENKFAIISDVEVDFNFEDLLLRDIYLSIVDSKDYNNSYTSVVHVFQINGMEFNIDVFTEDGPTNEVYVQGSYDIHWDSFNGSEVYEHHKQNTYGLVEVLNYIDYGSFFQNEIDNIYPFIQESREEESLSLLEKAKKYFPGLFKIEFLDYNQSLMIFESGAELRIDTPAIYDSIRAAKYKNI